MTIFVKGKTNISIGRIFRRKNYGKWGYSLDLNAPVKDSINGWFGHGGAWGTNCSVNYHKKELRLWVVQRAGGKQPWKKEVDKAADKFFKQTYDQSGIAAYTGRTE